jgi:hypothetical protein
MTLKKYIERRTEELQAFHKYWKRGQRREPQGFAERGVSEADWDNFFKTWQGADAAQDEESA